MSAQAYLIGWLAYLAGGIMFMALVWRVSRSVPQRFAWPLRALLAALVLLPWRAGPAHDELAPAWVVALFDGFVQEDISPWRAGGPLAIVATLALVLGLVEYWRRGRGQQPRKAGGRDD